MDGEVLYNQVDDIKTSVSCSICVLIGLGFMTTQKCTFMSETKCVQTHKLSTFYFFKSSYY